MRRGTDKRALGRLGEDIAERFMCARRCVVLARNYRCAYGEIDLVVEEHKTLIFVEVRSHTSLLFGNPLESVTVRKQRQIARAASHYVWQHCLENRPLRFDVIGIQWRDGVPHVTHVPGAFEWPSGRGRGGYVRY